MEKLKFGNKVEVTVEAILEAETAIRFFMTNSDSPFHKRFVDDKSWTTEAHKEFMKIIEENKLR